MYCKIIILSENAMHRERTCERKRSCTCSLFIVCLYLYCCRYMCEKRKSIDPINWFNSAMFCGCSKPRPEFPTSFVGVLFCGRCQFILLLSVLLLKITVLVFFITVFQLFMGIFNKSKRILKLKEINLKIKSPFSNLVHTALHHVRSYPKVWNAQ